MTGEAGPDGSAPGRADMADHPNAPLTPERRRRPTTASAPTRSTKPAASPCASPATSAASASAEPTPEPTSCSWPTTCTSGASTPPPANSSASSPSTPPATTSPPANHPDPPQKSNKPEPTNVGSGYADVLKHHTSGSGGIRTHDPLTASSVVAAGQDVRLEHEGHSVCWPRRGAAAFGRMSRCSVSSGRPAYSRMPTSGWGSEVNHPRCRN